MPKDNKGVRRNKLKRSDTRSSTSASKVRESLRSFIMGSDRNRYSPFQREPLRREPARTESTQVQGYNTKNLIGSGIKYIMFPLHLLHFCLFGSLSSSVSCERSDSLDDTLKKEKEPKKEEEEEKEEEEKKEKKQKKEEEEEEERKEKKQKKEREDRDRERNSQRSNSTKERSETPARASRSKPLPLSNEPARESPRAKVKDEPRSSVGKDEDRSKPAESLEKKDGGVSKKEVQKEVNEDSMDDMVTAAEDSDYSSDHWCSATSSLNLDMSVDNLEEELEKCRSVFEEPMDISMEEQCLERSVSGLRSPLQRRLFDKDRSGSFPPTLKEQPRKPGYSMDEEIAEIFQRKCVSSDEEYCARQSKRPTEKIRDSDRRYCAQCRKSVASPRRGSRKEKEENLTEERKKKKSSNDPGTPSGGKASTNEGERHNSSQKISPGRRRSRWSATPVKRKDTRREDARYRERATQTDSAFSDDDVEMIPVEDRSEKKSHGRLRKSYSNLHQAEGMDQDLEYIADNEDSSDGFRRSARRRIFSDSGSSSSADLGFDDDRKPGPSGRWDRREETPAGSTHRGSTVLGRGPPGFPELPQNPPLLTVYGDRLAQAIGPRNDLDFRPVAPAPSPMRHLYYDYPEFMDLPVNVNRSKILRNILRDNYSQ